MSDFVAVYISRQFFMKFLLQSFFRRRKLCTGNLIFIKSVTAASEMNACVVITAVIHLPLWRLRSTVSDGTKIPLSERNFVSKISVKSQNKFAVALHNRLPVSTVAQSDE